MSASTSTPELFLGVTWTSEYRLMAIATAGAPRTTKCSPARIILPGAREIAGERSSVGREDHRGNWTVSASRDGAFLDYFLEFFLVHLQRFFDRLLVLGLSLLLWFVMGPVRGS